MPPVNAELYNKRCVLQRIFECMGQILMCRNAPQTPNIKEIYPPYNPVDAMVGELDWITQLHQILEQEGLKPMPSNTTGPNERQIGGQHYREMNAAYQHWDLVAEYGLSYFTGCITKYATRWRRKAGTKDLEKAIHYTDKLINLYHNDTFNFQDRKIPTQLLNMRRFCADQQLSALEIEVVVLAVEYRSLRDLQRLRYVLKLLLEQAQVQVQTVTVAGIPAGRYSTDDVRTNAVASAAPESKRGLL